MSALPEGWTLTASAFNWTPDVVRADRGAIDIAAGIVADGLAELIEVEAGQVWRGFPDAPDAEVDELRDRLAGAGGRVSIVGASIDEFTPDGRRRTPDERHAFLLPQLRAAARLGALGVRLPIGQAGPELLRRLQPELHDLGVTLYEEAQGRGTPEAEPAGYATIAELGDPRIRLLIDISMLMPAPPVSYLEELERGGLDAGLIARLRDEWRDPATHGAVMAALGSGAVPPPLMSLYMDMIVRFGRSEASELRDVLGLASGIHLKFWDLDDSDGRISTPIREVGDELAASGFTGTLTSEWGGHAWLDDDATTMTRAHLALARAQLER
jgi:hypothetical protein